MGTFGVVATVALLFIAILKGKWALKKIGAMGTIGVSGALAGVGKTLKGLGQRSLAFLVFVGMVATIYFRFEKEVGWGWWDSWRDEGTFFFWGILLVWGILSTIYPKRSIPLHLTIWVILMALSVAKPANTYWPSNTSKPTAYAQSHRPTAPAGKQRYTKTIVAKPGAWSEVVFLPFDSWFEIRYDGPVKVRDMTGREWEDGPDKQIWEGSNLSIAEMTRRFYGIGKEVKVVIESKRK